MDDKTDEGAKFMQELKSEALMGRNIRSLIYSSKYWKEECVALPAERLVNEAMKLRFIGGISEKNTEPTPFLCLTLRMLEIQPKKDIVVEFIRNEEFKYVRALGAFYMRLTGTTLDCKKYLEPLYKDNRRLSRRNHQAQFVVVYMDDFIDEILNDQLVCDVVLPCTEERNIFETNRVSVPKDEGKKRKRSPLNETFQNRKNQRCHSGKDHGENTMHHYTYNNES